MITVAFEYGIGDLVRIVPINAGGVVLSLWYSDRGVRYQVAWWDNCRREEAYLLPCELEPWEGRKHES